MPNKMLIDASHPEETRVVVVHGNRIEEFDFESQDKKQLKGNIYLARVTRVEPSLQAAFVEYGGNRHGFLAFSEIHPDYYQIPVADRQALLRAEAEAADEDDEDGEPKEREQRGGRNRRRRGRNRGRSGEDNAREASADETAGGDESEVDGEASLGADEENGADAVEVSAEEIAVEASEHVPDAASVADKAPQAETPADEQQSGAENAGDEATGGERGSIAASVEADVISEEVEVTSEENGETPPAPAGGGIEELADSAGEDHEIESVGADDALEEVQTRRRPMRRQYKIQEVIKRRQILLVQVVKEERGNKGAALTTYLSLAGRYSVLMPNTARGGGISRKITNVQDRKRLKEVVQDLEVPQGMGVILRTAGESRTKAEIKRDYEYLMRLWENVRTLTLQSTAPALVYEEGSLIKRSVRDLYNKDIDEIAVSGDDGYREAKDFMRMLMPSHAKVVQPYRDTVPIFVRNGIEAQLDRMLQPQVTLKSGGYLIINQTEALVSIDVNSGRSTREHSIEETALHTNLEAAEEVARQLRLRDLAGLIVIDFIDMEENRNNRAVEKRLKDHLKNDRARIQLGRISHFGLMEMSRQRIRASVLESTMKPCPHCGGTGHVRSDSSVALLVVRAIEEFLLKDSRSHIVVKTPASTAMYVLNHKRATLTEMEARFGLTITLEADESVASQHYAIFRGAVAEKPLTPLPIAASPTVEPEYDEDPVIEDEEDQVEEAADQPAERSQTQQSGDGERGDRKRRKRRRRRGGRDRDRDHPAEPGVSQAAETAADDEGADDEADDREDAAAEAVGETVAETAGAPSLADEAERKKRRRGKRGGRRHREGHEDEAAEVSAESEGEQAREDVTATAEAVAETAAELVAAPAPETAAAEPEEAPKKPRRGRKKADAAADEAVSEPAGEEVKKPAKRASRKKAAVTETVEPEIVAEAAPAEAEAPAEPAVEEPAAVEPTTVSEPEPAPVPKPAPERIPETVSAEPAPDRPKKSGWWQRKGFF
ncbi:Rne/Rng family ribonuclease [Mesorhizobium sp. LHD-90]|uniref:Rne/Rng family ribonuclease n=1 Tax=Mesorhizobium sp. LHD-90 TaxID=3071414 RepID=UPI0027DEAE07|nr:Rne/Rng family ribonuclease [Mesorhizobium sp. LHD-90]MDQ6437255.1 Rne/Rng family ribonuclease [Mesorhizobium sp. LHD-90]